jgi:transposase
MADAPLPEAYSAEAAAKAGCPNCRSLEALILKLQARIETLEAQVQKQAAEIARLRRNSSNSSKPPSSDIVKPPAPQLPNGKKRKIGGQPGHERHDRAPFPPDQIDARRTYGLDACPECGGRLRRSSTKPRVLQQVELVEKPVVVTEHAAPVFWCPRCRKHHQAPLPREVVKAGLVGPRLTALAAWMKGRAHASYTVVGEFFADVLAAPVCRGLSAKLVQKARRALDPAYAELRDALPAEKQLHIDETGHPERKKLFWTWVFRAPGYSVFQIDRSRGSDVLGETLGKEFAGVIGCDYFSAYRKYMGESGAVVQFCLAHLVRDARFLLTLDPATKKYGERLLMRLRGLFRVIHRRERMKPQRLQRALERARQAIQWAATHPPWTTEARNMAERFRKHGDAYFRFITTPGVEPTCLRQAKRGRQANNLAEQALRFVVIDRRLTQGTRGAAGRAWCERIWTTAATCRAQGRSIFDFLCRSIHAHFAGRPTPSLRPA